MSLIVYYLYLLFFWSLFRAYFNLPEVIEELWFKPVIWLVPLMVWNMSLGKARVVLFAKKGLYNSLFLGVLFSFAYWLVFSLGQNLNVGSWNNVGVALSVAVVEELTFSGFIFGYLRYSLRSSAMKSLIVTSILASLSHLPFLFFENSLSFGVIFSSLLFIFAYSIVNVGIRMISGNIFGSILARFVLVFLTFAI